MSRSSQARTRYRALYVEDEPDIAKLYRENIVLAVRDNCGIEIDFEVVGRPEDARRKLQEAITKYDLVFADMMFPMADGRNTLANRGFEVIGASLKRPGVKVVVVTQGDPTRPRMEAECLELGVSLFRYKGEVQAPNPRTGVSGWDELAQQICTLLNEGGIDNTMDEDEKALGRSKRIFVVYGRDGALRSEFFKFLRSLTLEPQEWTSLVASAVGDSGGNPSVLMIIQQGFRECHGGVVLLTGDDEARLLPRLRAPAGEPAYETKLTAQPRQNVLFEAGYAMGAKPDRTLLVTVGSLRPISDLGGLHIPRINNSTQSRQDIAERLRRLGFAVDTSGTDWHTEGDLGA